MHAYIHAYTHIRARALHRSHRLRHKKHKERNTRNDNKRHHDTGHPGSVADIHKMDHEIRGGTMAADLKLYAGVRCGRTLMIRTKMHFQNVQESFEYLKKTTEEKWCAPRGHACEGCRASYLDHGSRRCSLDDIEQLVYRDLLKIIMKEEQ